jgi:peptidoglycan/LPS O-acetylase OafA/YrhL
MMVDLLSPGFGLAAMLMALATAFVASKWLPVETSGRNVPLDGLRGYMAFGVFLYHSVIWYHYLRTGAWGAPPASVYRPVGDLCVKVFFMITAYLFVGKIIDGKERPIDWLALFVSRALRLTPLYLFAVLALVVMTGVLTHGKLLEPLGALVDHVGQWVAFTMIAVPDINRLPHTWLLIAGVTWTLGYEWLFYLSLPLLALLLRRRVPIATVFICTGLLFWLVAIKPEIFVPWSFVAGALAAVVARSPLAERLRGPGAAVAVLIAVAWTLFAQDVGPAKVLTTLALIIGFTPIACGNPVLGILTNRPALLLGEVSYGLYLLHGLLLSFTFELVLGAPLAKTLSPLQHWAVVAGVGIVLVAVTCVTFRLIERPAMRSARRVTPWLADLGTTLMRRQKA